MGITVYEDFYKDAYQKALYSAPDALEFRTKLLNIFAVNSETKWIEAREIEERYKAIPVDIPRIPSHFIPLRITIFRKALCPDTLTGNYMKDGSRPDI